MLWRIDDHAQGGREVDPGPLGDLEPVDVLLYFDGPQIFTSCNSAGDLLLLYACAVGDVDDEDEADDDGVVRYLAVPTTQGIIDRVRSGKLTVREALNQPWAWCVDVPPGEAPRTAWQVDFEWLPESALPEPGIFLDPAHQPLLSVRMIGAELNPANGIPASVITRAVEGASGAIRAILDLISGRDAGRPTDFVRRMYDLPATGFRFASFEVSFGLPRTETEGGARAEKDIFQGIGNILERGLTWASSDAEYEPLFGAQNENRFLLEALQKLAPPTTGPITEVEIRGQMIGRVDNPIKLTRHSARRIKTAKREVDGEAVVEILNGKIREHDKDKETFILRGEGVNQRYRYNEALADDVQAAFDEDYEVNVVGWKWQNRDLNSALRINQAPRIDHEAQAQG